MKKILTICVPTYNRALVLIHDLKSYLSIDDERFSIKVNDNHSTDCTVSELEAIKDKRLSFCVNESNLGTIPNCLAALHGADSQYIMLLLDKNTIDFNVLPHFIDYLETENPCLGYVDLNESLQEYVINYKAGLESVTNVAYLSKHPSGFFWRTDLYENESRKDIYKSLTSFDFIFDLVSGPIASKYPASIVHYPLFIKKEASYKKQYVGSFGYDASNCWFGREKRAFEYECYLRSAISLELPIEEKRLIIKRLTKKAIFSVTTGLFDLMRNSVVCTHYHLQTRNVSLLEMINNTNCILSIFEKYCAETFRKTDIIKLCSLYWCKAILIDFKCLSKALFVKPDNGFPVSC